MAFLAFEPLKIVATTVRSVPFPLRILFCSYFDIAWLFALILFSVYFLLCRISISVLVSRTFCIWLVSTNWIFFLFCAPCIFSTNSNRHEHKLHFSQQILNGCLFRSLLAADLLRAPTLANILLLCMCVLVVYCAVIYALSYRVHSTCFANLLAPNTILTYWLYICVFKQFIAMLHSSNWTLNSTYPNIYLYRLCFFFSVIPFSELTNCALFFARCVSDFLLVLIFFSRFIFDFDFKHNVM